MKVSVGYRLKNTDTNSDTDTTIFNWYIYIDTDTSAHLYLWISPLKPLGPGTKCHWQRQYELCANVPYTTMHIQYKNFSGTQGKDALAQTMKKLQQIQPNLSKTILSQDNKTEARPPWA